MSNMGKTPTERASAWATRILATVDDEEDWRTIACLADILRHAARHHYTQRDAKQRLADVIAKGLGAV